MNIENLQGYNAQDYNALAAQYTERTGKTEAQLQETILEYVNSGKSFDEAVDLISNSLPPLEPPVYEQGFCLYAGALPASFGSTYLALIQDLAADQRRQAADAKALQTEALVKNIEEQADKIRTKAGLDLAAGIISGTMQIASGLYSGIASGAALGSKLDSSAMLVKNTQIQGYSSALTGGGSVVSSFFTFGAGMAEAQSKELEADAERLRATKEQLDRVDDAMRELLQKARSTQDAIQQNMNQTRSKILG